MKIIWFLLLLLSGVTFWIYNTLHNIDVWINEILFQILILALFVWWNNLINKN